MIKINALDMLISLQSAINAESRNTAVNSDKRVALCLVSAFLGAAYGEIRKLGTVIEMALVTDGQPPDHDAHVHVYEAHLQLCSIASDIAREYERPPH